jgi:hypothetical protein
MRCQYHALTTQRRRRRTPPGWSFRFLFLFLMAATPMTYSVITHRIVWWVRMIVKPDYEVATLRAIVARLSRKMEG